MRGSRVNYGPAGGFPSSSASANGGAGPHPLSLFGFILKPLCESLIILQIPDETFLSDSSFMGW